ncbi:substrate-binding periplasmic protein [Pseudomonas sp. CFBP 8772]|uniref:substrate-binding periplasmic protein n=1 Tax=Pseudomonas sp. CFBP 8772 TaxID=2775284 RepID=UPI001781BC6A|nr:transporter substrate-binding domain-containing protein [Pseudomonas sp. CFBP 8772]MBD8596270.1 ABC transporter substrate-binding protein [Pseudomonas sp. CFBP 8772]
MGNNHCQRSVLAAFLMLFVGLNASATTLQVVTEDSSYSALEGDKVVGVASEVVEMTLAKAGISDYHMALYPWARAYDIARLEANVLIYPMIRNSAREALFKWVGELEHVTPSFYKLRERRDLVVNALEDASHYTVGVVRDDSRQQYLEGKGFNRMVVSPNNLDNLRKLISGQVELIPMPEREAREQCADLQIAFEDLESVYTLDELSKGLYVALSASTPDETVQRIAAAFARLKQEGTVDKVIAGQ